MQRTNMLIFMFAVVLLISCNQGKHLDETAMKEAIEEVMNMQVHAWNEGSTEKFMAGYSKSDKLRFASGGNVSYGWDTLHERYQKVYPDKAAMGTLSFTELDITVLAEDAALVFGKYTLVRENDQRP